jgi:hypothetical protein
MKRNIVLTIAAAALAIAPTAFAEDSTVSVLVGPEASFVSHSALTTMSKANTTFGAYSGTTNFTYKIRTTTSGGTGAITVMVSDFGVNGPVVADLAYTCTAASGAGCSSSTAASTTVASPVVTFGADAHSADAGDAGTAVWTLADRTAMKTGTYTSTATFTISAT